jgi:hypothetical protein
MMASEYKKRGGGYTTDEKDKDESQKHLDNWTEEEWQTKEGSGSAKKEDGTEKRYLPKKAWEQLSEKEKEETEQKKQSGSREGKQYVVNTSPAKNARKNASKDDTEVQKSMKAATDCTQHWEDDEFYKNGQAEYQKFKESQKQIAKDNEKDRSTPSRARGQENEEPPKKRGRGANQIQIGTSKKQKNGGNSEGSSGTAGDITRVPEKKQKVQWKMPSGLVDGEVVEVVYEEKKVDGKTVKGSKEDPRVVVKSISTGKTAIHRPEAVYFH